MPAAQPQESQHQLRMPQLHVFQLRLRRRAAQRRRQRATWLPRRRRRMDPAANTAVRVAEAVAVPAVQTVARIRVAEAVAGPAVQTVARIRAAAEWGIRPLPPPPLLRRRLPTPPPAARTERIAD